MIEHGVPEAERLGSMPSGGDPSPQTPSRSRFAFRNVAALLLAGITLVLGYGVVQSWSVRLERIVVRYQSLPPAARGLTVLQISDLHSRSSLWRNREVAEMLSGLSADLMVVTGDFRQAGGSSDVAVQGASIVVDAVRERMPVYAVSGNHDLQPMMQQLSQKGIVVLDNTVQNIRPGVWLAGWNPYLRRHPSLEAVLRSVPNDDFVILLAHSPDVVLESASARAGLILCGHTHGGQMRLPGLRPWLTLTRLGTKYFHGLYPWGAGFLHINPGIGTTMIPLRMYAPPEITHLTLMDAGPETGRMTAMSDE